MDEQPEYVTLISCDDYSFVVPRSAASISPMIRRMMDISYGFAESRSNTCRFENIPGIVLEKVCEYFLYNERNRDAKHVPEMDIPVELGLELVIAADYLDI